MSNVKSHLRMAAVVVFVLTLLSGLSVLAQESGTGYLKVKANPDHAGVFIDGKYVGPAANFGRARKYAVAPGEHEIVLRDPLCQDATTKVTITAGKTSTISQTLQVLTAAKPPFGTLRVEGGSSKFDAVYINGKFMGHVDEFNNFAQGLLLNPGDYTLKVVSPDGKTELEQKITIQENKKTHIKVGATGSAG
jgi:hypothetical protein